LVQPSHHHDPFPPRHSRRIHKYAACSNESFIFALIYIDRLIQRSNFLLTELNVHRVVITAVLLAAKFFDDAYYNNAYYAKVGGVMVSEMNGLEVDFLFRINFSLHVTPEVYDKYRAELVLHSNSIAVPQQQQLSPVLEASHSPSLVSVSPHPGVGVSPPTMHQAPHMDATALHAAAEALMNASHLVQASAAMHNRTSHGIIVTDAEEMSMCQNDPVYFPPMQRANSMPAVVKPSLVAAAAAAPLFTSMPSRIGRPMGPPPSSKLPFDDPLFGLIERQCIYPIQNTLVHHHVHLSHPASHHHHHHQPMYHPQQHRSHHHHHSSSDAAAYSAQQLVGRMLASTVTGL
jgi:Cyclin